MRGLNKSLLLLLLMITGVLFTPVICQAKEKSELIPVEGEAVKDGVYPIEVESSSSMFRIVEAQLAVENGEMTATLTMSGTGYLKVYMGTAQEALAAEEEEYIPFVENEEGAHTYTVPVKALNQEIACAAFSKKKEQWYDRELIFLAETLPQEALLTAAVIEEAETDTIAEKTETEEKQSGSPAAIFAEDGEYTLEISLTGGTGRAEILSPVKLKVTGGTATALLEWDSPNYDYMRIDENIYYPINKEGNSVFEIPVLAWDEAILVVADTVAMSEPHEIEYQLTFHQSTLKKEADNGVLMPGLAAVIAAVILGAGVVYYGKKRKIRKPMD